MALNPFRQLLTQRVPMLIRERVRTDRQGQCGVTRIDLEPLR